MTDKIETARTIRIGAEALRKIAARETDAEQVAELVRIADEMDEHAAELERSCLDQQPGGTAGASA